VEPSASLDSEELKVSLPVLGLKILDEVENMVHAWLLETQADC
jgi:hypothetical protein